MLIKAVLFDLDGTLLDRDRSLQAFINAQYDRLIKSLGHIQKIAYISRFIELDCKGHVWKDKVYQTLVEEFKISKITWETLLEDYVNNFQQHCIPFDGLTKMLDRLREQGYFLGIITNGRSEFQRRSIDGLGIKDYFDVIFVSEEEQLRKPQKALFKRAIDRINVQAHESIFVGDNPEADIAGANNAGMIAIWKRTSYRQAPEQADAVIGELAELPTIIKVLNR